MFMILGQIAEIKTGIFAKPGPVGEAVYLISRHFDESGQIKDGVQANLIVDKSVGRHLLKPHDVLFAAKGPKNFAAVYNGEFPAVASTTFFVIRLAVPEVIPEYLVWQLNSPTTETFLKSQAIGSAMVSIPKSALWNLKIAVPAIEKQRRILEIARLSKAEYDLRLKIAERRMTQIQQQIINAIK